ncbi:MAG: FAD-binding protein [Planctomycetales bacterium]|nr:FAD-binding protein [Planctomycetales bacterium]
MNASRAKTLVNFGANLRIQPTSYYTPANEQEVLAILERHRGESIRVVGRMHSWSKVLDSTGVVLSLEKFDQISINAENPTPTATLGAGVQIKTALKALSRQGLTLPSLGLITEQTIAGATATGTHGSGKHSLSHYLTSIRLAHFDPESGKAVIREISDGPELEAARCSLGALGIVLNLTIEIRSSYNVEFQLHEVKTLDDALESESDWPLQQCYFLPWRWTYVVHQRRETAAPRTKTARLFRWYWFLTFDIGLHLVLVTTARYLKAYKLVKTLYRHVLSRSLIQRWWIVDESSAALIMEHELFRHIEIEMFVPASRLADGMRLVQQLLEIAGGSSEPWESPEREALAESGLLSEIENVRGQYVHHYPICIRKILPDATHVSMASSADEPWYAISMISYVSPKDRDGFQRFAKVVTRVLGQCLGGRPHWGKVCLLDAELARQLYPRLSEFQHVIRELDPDRTFSNEWLKQVIPTAP